MIQGVSQRSLSRGPSEEETFLLGTLLKRVSRSFYLTLRVLPIAMRRPVGLAYLLARAADTIADTSLIPPEQRLSRLVWFRDQVKAATATVIPANAGIHVDDLNQNNDDERLLLASLDPAFLLLSQLSPTDAAAVQHVLMTLVEGMIFDLQTFPLETPTASRIVALEDLPALDHYTYSIAGCVGEFWTTMTTLHLPLAFEPRQADKRVESLKHQSIRFGKALQMVNILRDCPLDLRLGRCYLPQTLLAEDGLTPQDLLRPDASALSRPLLGKLVRLTLDHFREALAYTLAMPTRSLRWRLACVWPIKIGLDTLRRLSAHDWLNPHQRLKMPRHKIYAMLAYSPLLVTSDRCLHFWVSQQIEKLEVRQALWLKDPSLPTHQDTKYKAPP